MAQIMQLWEAISLGSLVVKPQACGEHFPGGNGCARGMALEAVGRRSDTEDRNRKINQCIFLQAWPWTAHEHTRLPCEHMEFGTVFEAISHLFDLHVCPATEGFYRDSGNPWTLQQLIDWVRSVEPKPGEIINKTWDIYEEHMKLCTRPILIQMDKP